VKWRLWHGILQPFSFANGSLRMLKLCGSVLLLCMLGKFFLVIVRVFLRAVKLVCYIS